MPSTSYYDTYGLRLCTSSAQAASCYNEALVNLVADRIGTEELFSKSFELDPDFQRAKLSLARLKLMRGDLDRSRKLVAEVRASHHSLSECDLSFLRVIETLLNTGAPAATQLMSDHVERYPLDIQVAVHLLNFLFFFGGESRKKRIAQVLSKMNSFYGDDPGYAARRAFYLQEDGENLLAESLLRKSLQSDARNGNGAHAQAHLLMTKHRYSEAYDFLTTWLQNADQGTYFYCHLQWHRSICLIQMGRFDQARDLYASTKSIKSAAPRHLALADDVGFLWRLRLAGSPSAPAWLSETDTLAAELADKPNAFSALHVLLYGLLEPNHANEATLEKFTEGFLQSDLKLTHIFHRIAKAITAFNENDFGTAIENFSAFQPNRIEAIGGSNLERSLIAEIYIECLIRAGHFGPALKLLSSNAGEASDVVRSKQRLRVFEGLGQLDQAAATAKKLQQFGLKKIS